MKTAKKVALLLAAAFALMSQGSEGPFSGRSAVDWIKHEIRLELGVDLAKAGIRMPAGRPLAEEALRVERVERAKQAFLGITVDHSGSLLEALESGLIGLEAVLALACGGESGPSRFSADLGTLVAEYSYSLNDLASLLVRHEKPLAPKPPLDFHPSRKYTGILVYALEELPVRGEKRRAYLEPCLFPRIFDEGMNLIYEKNFAEPASIRAWGSIAYAPRAEDPEVAARVGASPLKVYARALFGTRRTDLVIDGESAAVILSDPDNRALLAKGRIVVICKSGE